MGRISKGRRLKSLLENLLEVNLNEDSFDDIFQPMDKEKFIQKRLKDCTKNSNGTYSCKGDVDLSELGLEKLPVRFKEVEGDFDCHHNKLTSLEGAPKEVRGNFDCSYNELTSLEGAPKVVGDNFWCEFKIGRAHV